MLNDVDMFCYIKGDHSTGFILHTVMYYLDVVSMSKNSHSSSTLSIVHLHLPYRPGYIIPLVVNFVEETL
jgi:hypothetical protein